MASQAFNRRCLGLLESSMPVYKCAHGQYAEAWLQGHDVRSDVLRRICLVIYVTLSHHEFLKQSAQHLAEVLPFLV